MSRELESSGRTRAKRMTQAPVLLVACAFAAASAGCSWDRWNFLAPTPPPGPTDSLVLRGDSLEAEAPAANPQVQSDLAGAKELFRRGEYGKARKIFHKIADNQKNPPALAEEARFHEAECLRMDGKYPDAADTYVRMMNDFPGGTYREQALQHMYDIANFWLDDTRAEMEMAREKKEGKRWFVPTAWVHFEKAKPFLDEEGRALEKLEQVRYNDMTGPMAPRALFLAGSVKFYREDYQEADYYFTQLVQMHPNSPLAANAVELAIISKNLSTGGSDYDGRKCAEARELVHVALENYPELAAKKNEFLQRQLIGINLQQAEKDYKMAEFWRRTGHPGSAYFYYDIVRRRYPGTKYFDLATERMHKLRAELEKKEGVASLPTPSEVGAPTADGTAGRPEVGPAPRRAIPWFNEKSNGTPAPAVEQGPAPRRLPDLGQ